MTDPKTAAAARSGNGPTPLSAVLVAGDHQSAEMTLSALHDANGTDWEVVVSPQNGDLERIAVANPPAWVVVDTSAMSNTSLMIASVEPWLEGTPVVAIVDDQQDERLQQHLVEAGATVVAFSRGQSEGTLSRTLRLATVREEIATNTHASTISVSSSFPMAFYRLSPMGVVLFANDAAVNLLGFQYADDVVGRPLDDFCPQSGCLEPLAAILKSGESIAGIEIELMHRSGRHIWVQLHAHTVKDRNGSVLYYEGAAVDVTPRRRAFETVAEIQQRFESFFERSQVAHWIEDFSALMAWLDRLRKDGVTDLKSYLRDRPDEVLFAIDLIRVVDVNPVGLAMIGATDKEQVMNAGLGPVARGDGLSPFVDQIIAAWEGKSSLRTTGKGTTLDGKPFEYILTWVVTVGGGADLGTVIVSLEDITELSEAQRRLTHLGELKDRFIDSITHELRTPLTGVFGFAELLRDSYDATAGSETQEYIDLLSSAAAGGAAILDNLLLAVELDGNGEAFAERIHLHLDRVDVVSETEAALVSLGRDARTQIQIDGGGALASADPIRVRQIVWNLLSNSIRYGGPEIRVRAYETDDHACLVIADDGEGIPKGSVERAFSRYESDSRDPGLTESLGIGLTVSRALAREMGGDLRYERSREASLFTLSLPLFDRQVSQ